MKWRSALSLGASTLLTCLVLAGARGEKKVIKVGGIFNEDNYDAQIAFKYAIDRVNMYNHKMTIEPIVHTVTSTDSFKTGKIVCALAADGVAAIFGPESDDSRGIVESICQALDIPNLQTSWIPDTSDYDANEYSMIINFFPNQQSLSEGIKALVIDYDWKSYTILYEDNFGLIRLQEVIKMHGPHDPPITVRQIIPGEDNRPLLKEIKSSGEVHIILDCAPENTLEYLRQANEIKLMEDYQSYILTSLDAHTIDTIELNKIGHSNVTCLRMVDPTSYELKNAVNDWVQGEVRSGNPKNIQPETVRLSVALMNDAVNMFGAALKNLDKKSPGINTMPLQCDEPNTWEDGLTIVKYMKMMTHEGLTGVINFDGNGKRKEFILDIAELSKTGFNQIGLWHSTNSFVNYTRSEGDVITIQAEKWVNKTFIVSSRIGAPFLMHREPKEGEVLTGNHRYEGYSMDLIDGIASILNFSYVFELVPDGKYGGYDKETKKWNGLVKELLDRRADLAICDLTITYDRRKAVDFTMPFMTLGVSILFSKPTKQPPDLFSFLSPLSLDVWIYMATAYLGVSLLLFVLARMAPKEWANPHPCDSDNTELENSLSLVNCMWMAMGSFLQQGSDILPKAVSTRMVAGMWWFFTLIMISSYTANLAAFLTNERMDATIESADDLAKQTKIKYGAVIGGSTAGFFRDSNFSTYKRMWAAMESTRPSVFVKDNDEGMDRVLKGKRLYAFLMESTSIEYMSERHCELTQIGGQLDSKGYGIAMPVNSIYRTAVSGAVLKMQEEGKLSSLKTKWWKNMHGGGSCSQEAGSADSAAAELGIENVGGVFVVLGCGCAIAFLVAVIEFLWNVRKVAVDEKMSLGEAFHSEFHFALNVWATTKPVGSGSASGGSSKRSSKERLESETKSLEDKDNAKLSSSIVKLQKTF